MEKKKYYVVWAGRTPGIYTSWADCQKQTNNFPQAKFKSYQDKEQAEKAFQEGPGLHWGNGSSRKGDKGSSNGKSTFQNPQTQTSEEIDYNSISVDVGTRGNPGPVEYQGVDTTTGKVLFSHGPISKGTNNLGEFLAIVHALAYLHKIGSNKTIYTDSRTAMKWVREKTVSTTLKRDASTEEMWNLVDRAIHWLKQHTYRNKIRKWDTKKWGEIKADYGRK